MEVDNCGESAEDNDRKWRKATKKIEDSIYI